MAFDGQTGQAAYAASKGGVAATTLPGACDLSVFGTWLNTVAPTLIDIPIYGDGEGAEEFNAYLGRSVLFPKRLGSSDEIASMVMERVTNSCLDAEAIRVGGGMRLPTK
ncbi:hypothetical protein ABII15_05775 [Streptomyces sp. HUAS MG91]|uniref:Uncharacterized protein n=1 Tax=Streptomyces tabacisoli TaxID=3156398 RepID=A0AAU8IN14_9ACTN